MQRGAANLSAIVRSAIESIQSMHPERAIPVESHGGCTGQFDADWMAQVFDNLLGNALAYSPRGSAIDVRLDGAADAVTARIHNLGEAISPERLAQLFEPFERGTSRANPDGLGLGLFIVQQLVAAHGGTVRVESNAGGTTFILHLPKS